MTTNQTPETETYLTARYAKSAGAALDILVASYGPNADPRATEARRLIDALLADLAS